MTNRQAIDILIREACRGVAGAGCGIREEVTRKRQLEVVEAARKVSKQAYDFYLDSNFFSGLGIYV